MVTINGVVDVDECDNAADMYHCVRDEAPTVTAAVHAASTGNTTFV
jgi:hypothetical protein